jgi:hypothetical protein
MVMGMYVMASLECDEPRRERYRGIDGHGFP